MGILLGAWLLGFAIGKWLSPSSDEESGRAFVIDNFRIESFDPSDVRLLVTAGNKEYRFASRSGIVTNEFVPETTTKREKLLDRTRRGDSVVGALGGLGLFDLWWKLLELSPRLNSRWRMPTLVGGAVLTIAGGGIGYRMGHRPTPDFAAAKFIVGLEDDSVWRVYAARVARCREEAVATAAPSLRSVTQKRQHELLIRTAGFPLGFGGSCAELNQRIEPMGSAKKWMP